jgi:Tol biopolymer transport system component
LVARLALVFSVSHAAESSSGQPAYSLWKILTDQRTGEARGKPQQLTQWSDYHPRDLAIATDGKQSSLQKIRFWGDVYLAELGPGGTSMKLPRRFTLDNRGSYFLDWARDSKAIVFSAQRNGKWTIFTQGLNESLAEAVVQLPEDYLNGAELSPDGSWLLYWESAGAAQGAPPAQVKPLLQNGWRGWINNPLPSPDGKYLAYDGVTIDSNVWMLEGF